MNQLKFIKQAVVCLAIVLTFTLNAYAADETFSREGSRKRGRSDSSYQKSQLSSPPVAVSSQTYGIPTYDALFKWVLSDDTIRPSFFHAFVPGIVVKSSERLDDHMNPVQDLQLLRTFLHSHDTQKTVKSLTGVAGLHVAKTDDDGAHTKDDQATDFLHEMIGKFEDIKSSFPKVRYDGTMDFVCELDSGEFALVEMQVIPQDCWDRRALAYVAAFYGNQLRKGQEWKDIKKVIGINILGGGKDELPHWKGTPEQFVRQYKFQEQLHNHSMFIDGIELWQYSIMNAPRDLAGNEKEKQDWIAFLKSGHHMSEADVEKQITTDAVKKAFERAKISAMPSEVQQAYKAEDKEYSRISEYTAQERAEGKIEGELIGQIKALIEHTDLTNEKIVEKLKAKNPDITLEQIEEIRASLKAEAE